MLCDSTNTFGLCSACLSRFLIVLYFACLFTVSKLKGFFFMWKISADKKMSTAKPRISNSYAISTTLLFLKGGNILEKMQHSTC